MINLHAFDRDADGVKLAWDEFAGGVEERGRVLWAAEIRSYLGGRDVLDSQLARSATAIWECIVTMAWAGENKIQFANNPFPPWKWMAKRMRAVDSQRKHHRIVLATDVGGGTGGAPFPERCEGDVFIHDVSHSLLPDGRADAAIFSCYPTKLAGAQLGGGAIVAFTNRGVELVTSVRRRLDFGINRRGELADWDASWCVEGVQGKISCAAAALIKDLMHNEREMWRRFEAVRCVRDMYAEAFGDKLPEGWQFVSARHVRPYLMQLEYPSRQESLARILREELRKAEIAVGDHFPPYRRVTLPSGPAISESEVNFVVKEVLNVFDRHA